MSPSPCQKVAKQIAANQLCQGHIHLTQCISWHPAKERQLHMKWAWQVVAFAAPPLHHLLRETSE